MKVRFKINENDISVDLGKLYKNIDIAESLSLLYGKKIKSIKDGIVKFSDGSIERIDEVKYNSIKPLIWW